MKGLCRCLDKAVTGLLLKTLPAGGIAITLNLVEFLLCLGQIFMKPGYILDDAGFFMQGCQQPGNLRASDHIRGLRRGLRQLFHALKCPCIAVSETIDVFENLVDLCFRESGLLGPLQ